MDFTQKTYKLLIKSLQKYTFQTIEEYFLQSYVPTVIIRHDVDSWPSNALEMAKIENDLGIQSTYYFRMNWQSYRPAIIKKIVQLDHEIGYHYEDLATANGDYQMAFEQFKKNLSRFRQFYPVKTVSMHGRPLSRWDSRDLWKKYNYKELGIVGEPYLDIDYNKVLYFTDTGGRWDGEKFSIRDNVSTQYDFDIHSTQDLVNHILDSKLPDRILINVHPARWNDNIFKWIIRKYILTFPKLHIKMLVKKIRQ